MRYLITTFLGILLLPHSGFCQTQAKITDVDFHVEGNNIVVNYSIVGSLPREHLTIELRFITERNEIIVPKSVTGDVGTKIFGDGSKTILWDAISDQANLEVTLRASVTITSSKILYGGPSNALLSVIVPGLGGYFVEKNKTRAIATTAGTLGLLGYGIYQKQLAETYYDDYKNSIESSEMDALYNKANNARHKYYISTGIAVGIWAFDIIWVTIKGFQNLSDTKSYYKSNAVNGLSLDYIDKSLQLKYSFSF